MTAHIFNIWLTCDTHTQGSHTYSKPYVTPEYFVLLCNSHLSRLCNNSNAKGYSDWCARLMWQMQSLHFLKNMYWHNCSYLATVTCDRPNGTVHVTSYLFFFSTEIHVVCHHGILWVFVKFSTESLYPLCRLASGTYQLQNTFLKIRLSCVASETVFTLPVKAA